MQSRKQEAEISRRHVIELICRHLSRLVQIYSPVISLLSGDLPPSSGYMLMHFLRGGTKSYLPCQNNIGNVKGCCEIVRVGIRHPSENAMSLHMDCLKDRCWNL